jgi:hypothetical protein
MLYIPASRVRRSGGRVERAESACGFPSAGKAYIIDLIMKYFVSVLAPA